MSFLVLQSSNLDGEERAGCFTFIIVFLMIVNVLWLFFTVPRVGLQCVIVVFPDHTHVFCCEIKNVQLHTLIWRPGVYNILMSKGYNLLMTHDLYRLCT